MRFARFGFIALTMVAMSSAFFLASAQPNQGRTFAFLVACGDYDPSELNPVPFTLNEMKLFRDVLIDSGTPAGNIVYLHDKTDKPGRLIPNRANILREYKLLLERLRPEDSLVVALSGHGIQYKTDAGGYFCPLDARLGANHKNSLVAMDGDEGLLTLLEKTKAQRKLVLVNACRNDPATNASLADLKLELRNDFNEEAPKGTVVLFACSKSQRSFFYSNTEKREDRRNRSLFMYHVTEAWKGTYAKGKKVTLDHVLSEVRDRVEEDAPLDFRNNQMPLAKRKNFEGSWVLASRSKQIFESRFMSGRNVIFLVDKSGSMEMKDEDTLDLEKWPLAVATIAEVMNGMPDMMQYQVILFSDKATYLSGNRDSWLKFEGEASIKATREALKKIRPDGGTNTAAAFEEAFQFRKLGLDTIILLSDGLPNDGRGVSLDMFSKLTDLQRQALHSKYLRAKLLEWNPAREAPEQIRINTIEFRGWTPEVGPYLKALASEHNGGFAVVR